MTATTALTVQNTTGVKGIHYIPAEFVGQQIEACIEDIGVDVIKTGESFFLLLFLHVNTLEVWNGLRGWSIVYTHMWW